MERAAELQVNLLFKGLCDTRPAFGSNRATRLAPPRLGQHASRTHQIVTGHGRARRLDRAGHLAHLDGPARTAHTTSDLYVTVDIITVEFMRTDSDVSSLPVMRIKMKK